MPLAGAAETRIGGPHHPRGQALHEFGGRQWWTDMSKATVRHWHSLHSPDSDGHKISVLD